MLTLASTAVGPAVITSALSKRPSHLKIPPAKVGITAGAYQSRS
jgi:hypothetical protein